MFVAMLAADLELEVWEALDAVTDPELDEPVTEMGFIETVEVRDARHVHVDFRLPTYWCSPNFAFLMGFGIRREVSALPWVHSTEVVLKDHCFGDQVNQGVNSDRAFDDIFAEYCDGARLDEVVLKFMSKAFDRRQESVMLGLKALGRGDDDIVAMTMGDLARVEFDDPEAARQLPRYLDLLTGEALAATSRDPAFPDWKGRPIAAADMPQHMLRLRGTRINMEFNGALCRGLASTRYREVEIGPDGPTLVDFIAGRVPHRDGAAARN